MKVVLISDTHTMHHKLVLPVGDIICHLGDHSSKGTLTESLQFLKWFSELKQYKYKIMICGNHEKAWDTTQRQVLTQQAKDYGIVYLEDSAWISPCGKTIWGSPVTKRFRNWAFMKESEPDLARHWAMIPYGLDLLLTHAPPYGILDQNSKAEHIGSIELLERVKEVQPGVHAFGHIHESYGHKRIGKTQFYNVSNWDHRTNTLNLPVVIDI